MSNHKSINNIISGFAGQIITIALGIIIPRLVLLNIGSEANGLLSTVTQIFTYFALLEAGVGNAALQALYGPIGSKDTDQSNRILAATQFYYKRTGLLYLAGVLTVGFLFPLVVHSSFSYQTVFLVTILGGLGGVVRYFTQAKYLMLIKADGRNYAETNISTIINILISVTKIILLCAGCNVVVIQAMYFGYSVLTSFVYVVYVRKSYPWLNLQVTPDLQALSKRNSAFIHQISAMIFNSTDMLVLSLFENLKVVSVYGLYTLLFNMVSTAVGTINGSIQYLLGQSYCNKQREKYLCMHDAFEIYNMVLVSSLYCIAGIFILPFLRLYTAGVQDINYIDPILPYLFIVVYLLNNGRESSNMVIKFAGHFKQTQWRSVLEAIINITVSLIGVHFCGIYGVLIGTIAALLYRTNDMIIYANKKVLHRTPWTTYRRWLVNLALFVSVTLISKLFFAHIALDTYPRIILWAAITCVVVIPLFLAVASIFDRETYRYAKELVTPHLKRVWNKLRGHAQTEE